MNLTITAGTSLPAVPVIDIAGANALMTVVNMELADQIGYALTEQVKFLGLLAQRVRSQSSLAALLRALSADASGADSVTLKGSMATELLATLKTGGFEGADVKPSYLWVTQVERFDIDGKVVSSTVAGDWKSRPLSDDTQVSSEQIPQEVWDSARDAYPNADLLVDEGEALPSTVRSENTVTSDDGSKEVTRIYCFETSPTVVVKKADVAGWGDQIDQAAKAASTQLEAMTDALRADLSQYDQVIANATEIKSMIDKLEAERAAAQLTTRGNEDLRLQRVRQETVRSLANDTRQPDVPHPNPS